MKTSRVLDIAKTLMAIPSLTPEDHDCQLLLIQALKLLGFSVVSIPCENASNFWAIRGSVAPVMVFAGHTDVVAVGNMDEWLFHPFKPTVSDGFLYGRGAADMKGSLAAMLVACENFIMRHPYHKGSIAFLITSAEEGPSELGTPKVLDYLHQINQSIDYCIVGEPTSDSKVGDVIKNGRRGSLSGKLTILGKQGHIAYPHLADNPIHRAFAVMDDLCKMSWDNGHPDFPPTSLQVSNIQGGTGATNVTPGHLEILFNFRYSPAVTAMSLQNKVDSHLQAYGANYTLEWQHWGEPFLTLPGDLLKVCQDVIKDICGFEPKLSTDGGTSDSRYIAKMCSEVIELGPTNATIHKINERVGVEELTKLSLIYEKILEKLLSS